MNKLNELIHKLCPNGVENKRLSEVANIERGKRVVKEQLSLENGFPVFQNSLTSMGYHTDYNYPAGTTYVIGAGAAGEIGYSTELFWAADDCFPIVGGESINSRYIFHVLKWNQDFLKSKVRKASIPRLSREVISNLIIPVPPLEIQSEIVRILDNFTMLTAELAAELAARKQQYEHYRDTLLTFANDSVRWLELNDVIHSLNTGLNPRQFFRLNTEDATKYYVTIREIRGGRIVPTDKTDRINDEALALCNNRSNLEIGDVLFSGTGTIGETAVIMEEPRNWNIKEGVYAIKPNQEIILPKYLRYLLTATYIKTAYMKKVAGGTVKSIPMGEMRKLQIPVPPISEQKRIVAALDRFDALCNDLSDGLPAEIEARQKQYAYYRDKLLAFKEYKENVG